MSGVLGIRLGARMSLGRRPFTLCLLSSKASMNMYCCQSAFRSVSAFRNARYFRCISFPNLSVSFDLQNYPNYQCRMQYQTGNVLLKKRRTEEEKKHEKKGRKVIRFPPKAKAKNSVIDIWKNMTVSEVAEATDRTIDEIFESMIYVQNSESYCEESSIIDNPQVIQDILKVCGYRYRTITRKSETEDSEKEICKDAVRRPPAPVENLRPRPPVVTVMGHVDHGKTTLLDSLRSANVVDQEFGGITQHIGAFSVRLSNDDIVTFLDTPGHAAFSAMRARGANVTDMVVLVVAADDGVMEQTIESIRMAQEAKVPIIVAINKIDKPGANIEATKKMLAQQGIVVEDLGGDVQAVPISALKKTNLETLVEAIVVQSQIMDLKAEPTGLVEGVIVEAQTDLRRGKLATVIIQRGTLRKGCVLVAGSGWARTRVMFSPDGSPISEAFPSTPVQVLGWRDLPSAGDDMIEVESEKRASEVLRFRKSLKMQEKQHEDSEIISQKLAEHRTVYEEALKKKRLLGRFRIRREGPRQKMFTESNEAILHIVVKGDVDGSVEAILDVLETYDDPKCKLDIVHYGVGNVTESDVELAEAFNAVIYAFNVDCLPNVKPMAKTKKIKINNHNVIYKMIDDIKEELNVRIPISQKEEVLGEANVLQEFIVNEKRKKVNIAGCRCVQGILKKKALYRVKRGEDVIFEGKLDSMRHLKDEVESIKKDIECGLKFIDKKLDFLPGDTIICYHMVDVKVTTSWNPGF